MYSVVKPHSTPAFTEERKSKKKQRSETSTKPLWRGPVQSEKQGTQSGGSIGRGSEGKQLCWEQVEGYRRGSGRYYSKKTFSTAKRNKGRSNEGSLWTYGGKKNHSPQTKTSVPQTYVHSKTLKGFSENPKNHSQGGDMLPERPLTSRTKNLPPRLSHD